VSVSALSEALTGWRCGVRVLEYRQLPLHATLVEAQNVQIGVVALNLEVPIVWSIPLIDGFDNFDLTSIEPKAHRHFDPEICTCMFVLFFLVHDIVGALCPYNKLLQLLESKQHKPARSPARCHRGLRGQTHQARPKLALLSAS
jgi:hypothetical protein